jgi:hypothetical protein
MIARKWQLSPALTAAMSEHHSSGNGRSDSFGLRDAVALADALAHHMGAGAAGGISLDEDGRPQGGVDLASLNLAEFSAAIKDEIEKAKVFLEIASRN